MRLVYLGSPAMAVPPLEALLAAGHEVVLVVSNPDRRRGRRGEPEPTPVKAAALAHGLAVADDPDALLAAEADLGVVVAYGRILRPHHLAHLPMVNLHFSLLPRWRGAAPVERAILAGDATTGVCVMDVEEGLDTGGVHAAREVPIGALTTAAELRGKLVEVGSELLVRTLAAPLGPATPQTEEGITYAHKLTVDDLRLRWDEPVEALMAKIRVGGAWCTFRDRRLKVHWALPATEPESGWPAPGELRDDLVGCGGGAGADAGALRLVRVQSEGKPSVDAPDWLRGVRPEPGERLA